MRRDVPPARDDLEMSCSRSAKAKTARAGRGAKSPPSSVYWIVLLTGLDKALEVPSLSVELTAKYQVPVPRFCTV